MKLSERLKRTAMRQYKLGRHKVSDWYFSQHLAVLNSGNDPETPPLRNVIERYQLKKSFVK